MIFVFRFGWVRTDSSQNQFVAFVLPQTKIDRRIVYINMKFDSDQVYMYIMGVENGWFFCF